MANKGLLAFIGGAAILTAGIVTSLVGQTNRLENQLKAAQAQQKVYQNVQEVIPAPQPERQYAQNQVMPSQIHSDLPPQTQLIGYTQEAVPVITQHWHQGYGVVPKPGCTAIRWLVGAKPYIPEWRRVPTGPVIHSQLGYQIQFKPIVTSAPRTIQPQYQLPSPPQPGFR